MGWWIMGLLWALEAGGWQSSWGAMHAYGQAQRGEAEWRSLVDWLEQSHRAAILRQKTAVFEACDHSSSGQCWRSDFAGLEWRSLHLKVLNCAWVSPCRSLTWFADGRTLGCQGHLACQNPDTGQSYRVIVSESGLIREWF